MNISSSPSFKGRSKIIRDADYICRSVQKAFPSVSTTKQYSDGLKYLDVGNDFSIKLYNCLYKKTMLLNQYREDRKYLRDPFKFYKEVIAGSKDTKTANCHDLATLAEMSLRMNSQVKCGRASLSTADGKTLEHCIAYVDLRKKGEKFNPKKIVIIDPWLGEADFMDNMFSKYKNKYNQYFNLNPKDKIQLQPKRELDLTVERKNELRSKFPQMVYKPNNENEIMFIG